MANKKHYGAWVSPKGEYFPVVDIFMHEYTAVKITGGLMPEIEDALPESFYLLASGWMRVVYEESPSFQGNKFTRYQKEFLELNPHSIVEGAEKWEDFKSRSTESYNFTPIYPYGENKVKTNVTIDSLKSV